MKLKTDNNNVRKIGLHLLSLLTTIFMLISILVSFIGVVEKFFIFLAILTLITAVTLRYVAIYHEFSKPTFSYITLILLFVAFAISGTVALDAILSIVSPEEFRRAFHTNTFDLEREDLPSKSWVVIPLVLAGSLIVIGSTRMDDSSPYPKPANIREIATSPVYFSIACTFFGLWAVLFVGIAIQRVLIIAPVFEELLKFGVALLVGSVLFGRSLLSRIGVAIVVGLLFGIVEHITTYPMEANTVYTFRILFHAVTTVSSVTIYTIFEAHEEKRLQWIAPAYPVIIHFFNNTFAVVSSVISVFGPETASVSLIYGFAAILLMTVVLIISFVSRKVLIAIHMPLEHVLSDLV